MSLVRYGRRPDLLVCPLTSPAAGETDPDRHAPSFADVLKYVQQANFGNLWKAQHKTFAHGHGSGAGPAQGVGKVVFGQDRDRVLLVALQRLYGPHVQIIHCAKDKIQIESDREPDESIVRNIGTIVHIHL